MNFYVYTYLRTDLTPYYIGKGSGNRAYHPTGHRNLVPKDKNRIVFIRTGISENSAFALERFYIKVYGRKGIDEHGILRNMTEGGSGASGHKQSTATRQKKREANNKRYAAMGGKHSPETIERMRQAQVERHAINPVSGETKQKRREKLLGRRKAVPKVQEDKVNKHKRGRSVNVEGVSYPSIVLASLAIGLSKYCVRERINNPSFEDYYYEQ